ncbi:hypothetical protein CEXT_287441 [Caerostris extrusa]|uniref:Uncharacterized protein n=1 Tax=Caerostris extrusa TaxID=172846 RepID=A0AAV4PSP7_CAEEX|nr:hypothetical protein CEXT_287441 [Caerostris extrusa]
MKNCHLESSSCKSVVARVLRKSHFYRPEEAMNQQSLLSATRGAPSWAGARANERNYLTNSRDRVTSSPPGKKKVNLQKTSSHSKNERGQVKQVVACVLTSFLHLRALLKTAFDSRRGQTPTETFWPMPSQRWVSKHPLLKSIFFTLLSTTSAVPLHHGQHTEVWDSWTQAKHQCAR